MLRFFRKIDLKVYQISRKENFPVFVTNLSFKAKGLMFEIYFGEEFNLSPRPEYETSNIQTLYWNPQMPSRQPFFFNGVGTSFGNFQSYSEFYDVNSNFKYWLWPNENFDELWLLHFCVLYYHKIPEVKNLMVSKDYLNSLLTSPFASIRKLAKEKLKGNKK